MDAESKDPTFVSIVVVSKDRHDELEKAVDSLKRLDYPRDFLEIILVEEGDEPQPLEDVNYVFLPRRDLGLGYARNTGVRNARGEIIAFTDDDCIVDPAWLKEMLVGFKDPAVAGVAGSTFAQEGSLIGICEDILGFPGGGHKRYHSCGGEIIETQLLSTCNCAYRREVFDRILFKEDSYGRTGAEDYHLGINVARQNKCLYVPSAVVKHKPRGSLRKIITWFSRRRINELLIEEVQEGRKNYRPFLKAPHRVVLLRVFLAFLLLVVFGWIGIGLLLLGAVAWYSFILIRSLPVMRYFKSRTAIFLVPIVRFFMDLGAMVGEWRYLTRSHEGLGLALDEFRR